MEREGVEPKKNKGVFFLLWILCIIGAWSVLPYVHYLGLLSTVSFSKLFWIVTLQAVILYGVVCFLSYFLIKRVDLFPFASGDWVKRVIFPGIIWGVVLGFLILAIDVGFFHRELFHQGVPPRWAGAISSIYGAINEEVLLRLFLFTLIYYVFCKIFKRHQQFRLTLLWITSVITAIVFGVGHLPAALKLSEPSGLLITRILLLNGIPGVIFSWLYWSRGFWAAVLAHFVTDIVIHVVFA